MTATTIKIDSELRDQLNAEARARGVPVGSVVEQLWQAWQREQRFAAIRAAMSAASEAERERWHAEDESWQAIVTDDPSA